MKSDRQMGRHYMGHQRFVSVVDSRLIIVSPLQLLRHTPARWYTTQFTYVRKTTTTKKVVWTGPYITSTNLNLFFFFFFPCVAQTDAPYCPWKQLESWCVNLSATILNEQHGKNNNNLTLAFFLAGRQWKRNGSADLSKYYRHYTRDVCDVLASQTVFTLRICLAGAADNNNNKIVFSKTMTHLLQSLLFLFFSRRTTSRKRLQFVSNSAFQ
jgi:hypothetical protein